MSSLDRKYQETILRTLQDHYPDQIEVDDLDPEPVGGAKRINLIYLQDHRLVEVVEDDTLSNFGEPLYARITHLGMDFLAADGGLSAILNVVTVRLHDNTIKDLIGARIAEAEGDESVKAQMIKTMRAMPAEATRAVAMQLLQAGLAATPATLSELGKLLFHTR